MDVRAPGKWCECQSDILCIYVLVHNGLSDVLYTTTPGHDQNFCYISDLSAAINSIASTGCLIRLEFHVGGERAIPIRNAEDCE